MAEQTQIASKPDRPTSPATDIVPDTLENEKLLETGVMPEKKSHRIHLTTKDLKKGGRFLVRKSAEMVTGPSVDDLVDSPKNIKEGVDGMIHPESFKDFTKSTFQAGKGLTAIPSAVIMPLGIVSGTLTENMFEGVDKHRPIHTARESARDAFEKSSSKHKNRVAGKILGVGNATTHAVGSFLKESGDTIVSMTTGSAKDVSNDCIKVGKTVAKGGSKVGHFFAKMIHPKDHQEQNKKVDAVLAENTDRDNTPKQP